MTTPLIEEIAKKYRDELATNFMDTVTSTDLGVINRALEEYAARSTQGMVMVPVEPTPAMLSAAIKAFPTLIVVDLITYGDIANIYKAMLAAQSGK